MLYRQLLQDGCGAGNLLGLEGEHRVIALRPVLARLSMVLDIGDRT